jgi:hypothetical protein
MSGSGQISEYRCTFVPRIAEQLQTAIAARFYALLKTARTAANSYWAWLCSCDIAYVAIRNIGIHRLAAKGTYVFDFNDVLDRLGSRSKISVTKLQALKKLRFLKHAYRNRLSDIQRDNTLECALDGAEVLFGVQISAVPTTQIAKVGYSGLRVLELSLVERFDPRCLDTLESADGFASAWQMISNPRGYPKPWKNDSEWIGRVTIAATVSNNAARN